MAKKNPLTNSNKKNTEPNTQENRSNSKENELSTTEWKQCIMDIISYNKQKENRSDNV